MDGKIPIWIQFISREPFAYPGLRDCWIDRDTGKPLYTFTIIPTHWVMKGLTVGQAITDAYVRSQV
jgi:hypothetical protein